LVVRRVRAGTLAALGAGKNVKAPFEGQARMGYFSAWRGDESCRRLHPANLRATSPG